MRAALGTVLGALILVSGCSGAHPDPAQRSGRPPSAAETFTRGQQIADLRGLLRVSVRVGRTPGVVLVVRHRDHTDVLVDGVADAATGEAMTSRHRFRIASITKSMVSAVVMQLVEDGDLALDDPVGQWLPGMLPQAPGTTVEQLLSHSSGLPDDEDLPVFPKLVRDPPVDPRAIVAAAARAKPLFAPGEGQAYSDSGYLVLGLLVERVTGRSLEDNLERRVFDPLRMNSASLRRSRVTEPPWAHGYSQGEDVSGVDLTHAWAGGGVVADAPDVSRFFDALFSGHLVAKPLVDRMSKPVAGDLLNWSGYGLGIGEQLTRCGPAYGNSGAWDGFSSVAYTRRDVDRSAVILVNTEAGLTDGALGDILDTALCGP